MAGVVVAPGTAGPTVSVRPAPDNRLPVLRQELGLYPADTAVDGSPTWTLHDPAANRFYRIGWPAFEILSRWNLGNAQHVVQAVRADTTLEIDESDVMEIADMLIRNHLVQGGAPAYTRYLLESFRRGQLAWTHWLLEHYLFFRIPLWRPMRLLGWLMPLTGWAFRREFWLVLGGLLVTGLFLVSRQWDSFIHAFSSFDQWSGILGLALALTFSKVLHEFGHALSAYRQGCHVPTMGIAFLVMWPVLYTDVNESWKLHSRQQRLQVAGAGILTELGLAALATFAWSFLDEGPLKAAAFLLATSTWLITLAINASPFMRFDGYFLLSDWLGIDNLHARAFAMGRWWLRERLFALGAPPPETLPRTRAHFMVAFAYATWIYRLILFLGIALLVYHFSFKLLGIFLLGVELWWFIFRPFWMEFAEWWHLRREIVSRRRSFLTFGLFLGGLSLLALPLQTSVSAPAMLTLAQRQILYTPAAGVLGSELPQPNQTVVKGDTLFRIVSPDLEHQLQNARLQAEPLRWQHERQSLSEDLRNQANVLASQHEEAAHAISAWRREADRLDIQSPMDGVLLEVNDAIQPGGWVARNEWLGLVGLPNSLQVDAYVEEVDLQRLSLDAQATFIPENPDWPAIDCRVGRIDRTNVDVLDQEALSKTHGGSIATDYKPHTGLVPISSHFRVRLKQCQVPGRVPFELRGIARIDAERISPLSRMMRYARGVLIREMSF